MAVVWGVQGGGKYSKLGLFSKATFRLEDGQDIDIEDKDFWIKVPLLIRYIYEDTREAVL
jgi:hypothetical protein